MKITKAKNKLEATKQFATELLLTGVGGAAIAFGLKDQVIEPKIAMAVGAVCLTLGLAPSLVARIKDLFSK